MRHTVDYKTRHLVALAKRGDESAFNQLCRVYGERVVFTHIPNWEWPLIVPMWILADGSGEAEPLAEARQFAEKPDLRFWGSRCLSPDGKYLLGGTNNIWVLPMESKADP